MRWLPWLYKFRIASIVAQGEFPKMFPFIHLFQWYTGAYILYSFSPFQSVPIHFVDFTPFENHYTTYLGVTLDISSFANPLHFYRQRHNFEYL